VHCTTEDVGFTVWSELQLTREKHLLKSCNLESVGL